MPNFAWEQTQFRGIHTQPAKTAEGHLYAEDTENLRIDGEGWLQLRSDVIALDPDGDAITGVATTLRHVFTLREDGRLYVREVDTLAREIEIAGVSNLEGRISIVDFGTYAVLTSEGPDRGYIIDLQDDEDTYLDIYPLGLDPPDINDTQAFTNAADNTDFAPLHSNRIYVFRITFAQIFTSRFDVLRRNERKSTPPRLIEDIESNLSDPVIYRIGQTSGAAVDFVDTEGNPYTVLEPPVSHDIVNIRVQNLPHNTQANAVLLYQSGAITANVADTRNIDNLTYRLVDFRSFDETDTDVLLSTPFEFSSDRETDDPNYVPGWTQQPEFRGRNDRLPADVKQLYRYNDRIFAPAGDRLVYSDVDFGNIVPWAFPAVNDIRVEGRVDFCAEINEVLLFGSRDGLWRLAGNTEYNFAVGQISHSGPIDGYAWSRITDALAFVGEGGLFITDASQVIRVSETVLDDFFQDKQVVRGAVAFFKDGDVLYSVTLEDSNGNTEDVQFKREDAYWVRWNLPFMQSASIIEANRATLVLVADGTGRLKRLDWNSTANEEADVAWSWTSQFLDEPGPGLANRRKRYSQFQWTGEAENAMRLQVWKDNEVEPAVEKTFESRANLIPVRVPINRIARRLRFKVSGRGRVKIQGMRVVVMI